MSATRILSDAEKRQLDIAYQRVQAGKPLPSTSTNAGDIRNIEFAKTLGYTPSTSRDLAFTQPITPQQPLPVATGENEALVQKYITEGYTPEQATSRVNELMGSRPGFTAQTTPQQNNQQIPNTQTNTNQDLGSSWQSAMTNLLRDYQTNSTGINQDLNKQRGDLINARFNAVTAPLTPEQQRTLTSSAQSQITGIKVGGIEDQLSGVNAAIASRKAEQDQLRQVMDKAQQRMDDLNKPVEVNGQLINPQTGEVVFAGTPKQQSISDEYGTGSVGEFNLAKSQGYTGSFIDFQREMANLKSSSDGYKPPTSYQEWQLAGSPGTYADYLKESNTKAPTAGQQTVATYAARLEQSNPVITSLTPDISKMNFIVFDTQRKLPSTFQSSTFQQYDQASRNFINAVLRRESGAVISPSEFDNAYKQYLPKPGDTTATLTQKKNNRDLVYASLKNAAGNAYQSVDELLGTQTIKNDPLGIR